RDDDVDVLLRVILEDRAFDDRVRRGDLAEAADLERDLRELRLLELLRPGAAVHDPLAESELAGVERDVDVLVELLRGEAAADPRGARALLGHADDLVIVGAELDRLA